MLPNDQQNHRSTTQIVTESQCQKYRTPSDSLSAVRRGLDDINIKLLKIIDEDCLKRLTTQHNKIHDPTSG